MERELNIAIVGCGIAGMAAACLLKERGHSVTIIERFETPKPVGSGLMIQPVGQAVLAEIGILDKVTALGARIERMLGHTVSGKTVLDVKYSQAGADRFGLAIHRSALFSVLHTATRQMDVPIQGGLTVRRVDQATGLIRLTGEEATGPFDLIVDASGATSPLIPQSSGFLKYGALWGTVDWPGGLDLPATELRQRYHRATNMLGILPIGRLPGSSTAKAAVFWSLRQSAYEAWRQAPLDVWKAEALAMWPAFGALLDQIRSHDDMTMALYRHGSLGRCHHGRLVHIGDAAHSASPQLGQGANMALLDALALSRSLDPAKADLGLSDYQRSRSRHVRFYQAMSWAFTPVYQSDSLLLPWLRDHIITPLTRIPPVPRLLGGIVCGDIVRPIR